MPRKGDPLVTRLFAKQLPRMRESPFQHHFKILPMGAGSPRTR